MKNSHMWYLQTLGRGPAHSAHYSWSTWNHSKYYSVHKSSLCLLLFAELIICFWASWFSGWACNLVSRIKMKLQMYLDSNCQVVTPERCSFSVWEQNSVSPWFLPSTVFASGVNPFSQHNAKQDAGSSVTPALCEPGTLPVGPGPPGPHSLVCRDRRTEHTTKQKHLQSPGHRSWPLASMDNGWPSQIPLLGITLSHYDTEEKLMAFTMCIFISALLCLSVS